MRIFFLCPQKVISPKFPREVGEIERNEIINHKIKKIIKNLKIKCV